MKSSKTDRFLFLSYFATNYMPCEFVHWNAEEGRIVIRDLGYGEAYYNKSGLDALFSVIGKCFIHSWKYNELFSVTLR